jgi:hypothetical protein
LLNGLFCRFVAVLLVVFKERMGIEKICTRIFYVFVKIAEIIHIDFSVSLILFMVIHMYSENGGMSYIYYSFQKKVVLCTCRLCASFLY